MNPIREYRRILLPREPRPSDLHAVVGDYESILRSTMELIVERYERGRTGPWVNTKINLLDGSDFPDADRLRGPATVYGWIQGRALEALSGHARWLRDHQPGPDSDCICESIEPILQNVLVCLRTVRSNHGGHVFFCMTRRGDPFQLDAAGNFLPVTLTEQSPHNFSDLFCAKGMYAAAGHLEDGGALAEAREYCRDIDEAIWNGRFASDQQQLDPKNPMDPDVSRLSHGRFMIQIGAAALRVEFERDSAGVKQGLKLIRYILKRYVNLDRRFPELEEFDFVEFVDDEGAPYRRDDCILSDPGHALEFVGLALKLTELAKRHNLLSERELDDVIQIESQLLQVLLRNFENGFQEESGGICKLFDLVARKPVNTDMPWWSLPETMRAALLCYRAAESAESQRACLRVFSACHNAFADHYVKPELNLMAVQTRGDDGRVVDVIPATPDVDPGYHTGLCLIDCWRMLQALPR